MVESATKRSTRRHRDAHRPVAARRALGVVPGMHCSEGFHGPWQPETGFGASQRGPSDFAEASLRDRLAAGIEDKEGDAAATEEINHGMFSPFVATAPEQYKRLVALESILQSDVVCDLGFGEYNTRDFSAYWRDSNLQRRGCELHI